MLRRKAAVLHRHAGHSAQPQDVVRITAVLGALRSADFAHAVPPDEVLLHAGEGDAGGLRAGVMRAEPEDDHGDTGCLLVQGAEGGVRLQRHLHRQRIILVADASQRVFALELGGLHARQGLQQRAARVGHGVVVDAGDVLERLAVQRAALEDPRHRGPALRLHAHREEAVRHVRQVVDGVVELPLPQAPVAAQRNRPGPNAAKRHRNRAHILAGIDRHLRSRHGFPFRPVPERLSHRRAGASCAGIRRSAAIPCCGVQYIRPSRFRMDGKGSSCPATSFQARRQLQRVPPGRRRKVTEAPAVVSSGHHCVLFRLCIAGRPDGSPVYIFCGAAWYSGGMVTAGLGGSPDCGRR